MQTIGKQLDAALKQQTLNSTATLPTNSDWRPTCDAYEPSLQRAVRACQQFAADVARGAQPYWLTISGVQGSGKTYLIRQTFDACRPHNPGDYSKTPIWLSGSGRHDGSNRRPGCVWMHSKEFASRVRNKEWDLPEYLRADFLVAFDDLGASRDRTEHVADMLYDLANYRLNHWMLWSSNLSLEEISKVIDPRLGSRLVRDSNKLVTITAGDYALRPRR